MRFYRFIILVTLLLLAAACSQEPEETPTLEPTATAVVLEIATVAAAPNFHPEKISF